MHAQGRVVVPCKWITLGWSCVLAFKLRLKWAKFTWEEQLHHSCWFSSRTSPISLGWGALCGLLTTWKHQVLPCKDFNRALSMVFPLCSTLCPIPLSSCLMLQAVLGKESWWNRLCQRQLHSIQESEAVFHYITSVQE